MHNKLENLKKSFWEDLEVAKNILNLEQIKNKYFGRSGGGLTEILKSLKDLSIEDRKKYGPIAQQLKQELEQLLNQKFNKLKNSGGH